MKKRVKKKLDICKETVVNLNDIELIAAKAGKVTVTQDCQPTWQTTCNPIWCHTTLTGY